MSQDSVYCSHCIGA